MFFFADDSPILSEKEIKTEKIDEDQEKEDDSLEDPDDDPIVKEIPVFLSKGLSKNLHLFQVSYMILYFTLFFFKSSYPTNIFYYFLIYCYKLLNK